MTSAFIQLRRLLARKFASQHRASIWNVLSSHHGLASIGLHKSLVKSVLIYRAAARVYETVDELILAKNRDGEQHRRRLFVGRSLLQPETNFARGDRVYTPQLLLYSYYNFNPSLNGWTASDSTSNNKEGEELFYTFESWSISKFWSVVWALPPGKISDQVKKR